MLNAYRITACDWYAAHSFEQAQALAAADMDCTPDDATDRAAATGMPEPLESKLQLAETGGWVTVRQSLAQMDGPGWFAGTDT